MNCPVFPVAALLLLTGLSVPAQAGLGGSASSIEVDRSVMNARAATVSMGPYVRHALTRNNGGSVHELTNASGQVFAVTWSGPGKPDLRALLGSHFDDFQAASTVAPGNLRALRRPVLVNQPDLQILTEGHMGWFRGVAYIPSLAPSGFSVSDLAQER